MLYYSHVNEDNNVEREMVFCNHPGTIFCITGSGERVISLLDSPGLKRLMAVDINREAQLLLKIKLAALQYFTVDEYLEFIGFKDTLQDRKEMFKRLFPYLDEESSIYWRDKMADIEKGILNAGHFEKYMKKLRSITNFFLGKSFFKCFDNSHADLKNFSQIKWNFFLGILSSQYFFRISGNRDIAFCANDCNCRIISEGLQKTLESGYANKSFMYNLIFKGHIREMEPKFLPSSLRPEVLDKIKQKLIRKETEIIYLTGDLETVIKENAGNLENNTFFSFSDILSFNNFQYLMNIFTYLKSTCLTGLSGVFRSFLRNSINPGDIPEGLLQSVSDLSGKELTNMYKVYYFVI